MLEEPLLLAVVLSLSWLVLSALEQKEQQAAMVILLQLMRLAQPALKVWLDSSPNLLEATWLLTIRPSTLFHSNVDACQLMVAQP